MEMLELLAGTRDFPPRWHCGNWSALHGWVHVVSDLAIFAAYMAIPLALAGLLRGRDDLPFRGVLRLFVAFIVSCGLTHLIEAVIFWLPIYRVAGAVKAATAVVSWCTVFVLVRVLPEALRIRSPVELQREVAARAAELVRAETRFREVVEALPDGLVMVTRGGEILLVNRRAEELFGYPREELLGRPVEILVPEAVRGGHAGLVDTYFENPVARELDPDRDLRAVRRDGSRFPVEIHLVPMETSEGPAALAAVQDLTERRSRERERTRLIRELRRSNEELEQFAYVASHDLQEPLRTVVNFTELIQEHLEGRLDERDLKYMGYIVEGGRRMQVLVDDLLAFSRIGKERGRREAFPADRALDAALRDLGRALEETGGRVERADLPVIHGDPVQLAQVFANLVGNSLKFARPQVPPRIRVRARRDPGSWRFMIEDNGIGIEPRHLARIFRPFQRLHRRDEIPGSGIGLALVKKIVEGHGGKISVESTPGEGTTVSFSLPVEPPREEGTDA